MTIYFRVDSSSFLGFGHLSRCLSLAFDLLNESSLLTPKDLYFISMNLEGNFNNKIIEAGYNLIEIDKNLVQSESDDASETLKSTLTQKEKLIIIDNYKLSSVYEELIKHRFKSIFVIDDKANRAHYCDYLLDQNYRVDFKNSYNNLVSDKTLKFLGPKFSILRSEFLNKNINNINSFKKISVFFGGGDSTGETYKFLESLPKEKCKYFFNVIITKKNIKYTEILKLKSVNFNVIVEPLNFAEVLRESDFYIGSGGIITWERMALGVVGAVISVADNQEQVSQDLASGTEPEQFYWGSASSFDYGQTINKLNEIESLGIDYLQLMQKRNLNLIYPHQYKEIIIELNRLINS